MDGKWFESEIKTLVKLFDATNKIQLSDRERESLSEKDYSYFKFVFIMKDVFW